MKFTKRYENETEVFETDFNFDVALQAIVALCKKQAELIDCQLKMANDILNPQQVVVPEYNEPTMQGGNNPFEGGVAHQHKQAESNPPMYDYSQIQPRPYAPNPQPKPQPQQPKLEPTYDPRKYNRAYIGDSNPPYQVVSEEELQGYGDPGTEYRT